MKTKAFTVALADWAHMVGADYFGTVSGHKVPDKFARSGYTAVKSKHVNAPVIEEFPLVMECELADVLKKGSFFCVVGQIVNTAADERILDENGKVDVTKLKDREMSRFRNLHLGFVFQFHQLLPEFTAMENVMIPALIARQSKKEARQRAEELLTFLGLKERLEHKPNELSGGEKQRVAVARALMNHPDVILADEPSGSLDSNNKAELHQLFFDLRDKFNQTFVIVTHDEELARLTDRTIHLKDGVIVD